MYYRNVSSFKKENGYEIDGVWYPRVTSIVSIKAKPALYRYYAEHNSYAEAQVAMNRSAQEGVLVHDVVEGLLEGKDPSVSDYIRPAVEAFLSFSKRVRIIPHQIESQVVSHSHHYAGTIDVLAEINGKLGVLDIKTSQAIYRDYNIQTAAYVEALREDSSMPDLARWILRIDQSKNCSNGCGAKLRQKGGTIKIKNGSYQSSSCVHKWGPVTGHVEFKELDGLGHDVKAFLAAKQLWEWEHDHLLRQIRES